MHIGRTYPYHPRYWATECFFWPGFVPWKLHGRMVGTPPGDWSGFVTPWEQISEVGNTVLDDTQIFYSFPLVSMPGITQLTVSMEQTGTPALRYARWRAILKDGATILTVAHLYQIGPQRVCKADTVGWNLVDVIPPVSPLLQLEIRPATYAEGGTPFPNY